MIAQIKYTILLNLKNLNLLFITVFGQSKNLARGLSTTPARLDQNHPIFANEDPAKNPERDLVNFPRRKRALYEAPTRHFIFPEEWFTFFHEKTGI